VVADVLCQHSKFGSKALVVLGHLAQFADEQVHDVVLLLCF
jgi:hypothetical protein